MESGLVRGLGRHGGHELQVFVSRMKCGDNTKKSVILDSPNVLTYIFSLDLMTTCGRGKNTSLEAKQIRVWNSPATHWVLMLATSSS